MTALEELYVDQNRLTELVPEVCGLPKLKTLSLCHNLLPSLPAEVREMHGLTHLHLGDNVLAWIPPEIGACKELRTLYIHHNHFTALPASLHALQHLMEISLEWFRYSTPPLPRVLKGSQSKR